MSVSMFGVHMLSNPHLSTPAVNKNSTNKPASDISFKGYYSGAWDRRELKPETVDEIKKAAETSGAPKEFVQTLVGASKGAYYNPIVEQDFVFSPANIVDIVKAYTPEKQAAFDYLSDQEADMYDEERFNGDEMSKMYRALDKNGSMAKLKKLVSERLYTGYVKYNGTQIANLLKSE